MLRQCQLHKHFRPVAAATLLASFLFFPASATPLESARITLTGKAFSILPGVGADTGPRLRLAQTTRRKVRKRRKPRRSRSRRERPAASGPAKDIPGRYAILRAKNKDAGCLLSLNRSGRAQVGPGCQDHGIQIFDPVRWSLVRGTLTLRARAGHRVSFGRRPDGTWQRTPPAKKALGLRKY